MEAKSKKNGGNKRNFWESGAEDGRYTFGK